MPHLQEVVYHHVERNGTVYVVLLDSAKAFDTVPHDALRIKLYEYGVCGKLWLLLDNMYRGLRGFVLLQGSVSKTFELKCGIR